MSNLPRVPVRLVEENQDLLKSQNEMMPTPMTDYKNNVDVPEAKMEATYRAPSGRNLGNQSFRRYADGTLDIDAAKNVVIDAVHKAKDHGDLTELEKLVLTIVFPMYFAFVDARLIGPLTAVQLRLSPSEVMQIQQVVVAHLITEMNWNAGLGGGGDPGRIQPKV